VAGALGRIRPVPGLPARGQADDLHDEPDRVDECPAQEGDPQPGPVPSEQAVLKVLYLAVRNLEEFRSPNTGIRSSGWKQALQAFTIYFDGRIPTP
jgi:hypothetical protein